MSDIVKKQKNENALPGLFGSFFGNDFFNNFFDGDIPAINVKETKTRYKLDVSVPGYHKDNLEVKVIGDVLTISGFQSSDNEEKDEDSKILRREFSSSSFSRSFTLPQDVELEKIDVKQKNGILEISLPKTKELKGDKTKKIEIK